MTHNSVNFVYHHAYSVVSFKVVSFKGLEERVLDLEKRNRELEDNLKRAEERARYALRCEINAAFKGGFFKKGVHDSLLIPSVCKRLMTESMVFLGTGDSTQLDLVLDIMKEKVDQKTCEGYSHHVFSNLFQIFS